MYATCAVVPARGGVQIHQDLQAKLLRPVKGFVQILVAVDIRPHILKEEKGRGYAHGIEALDGDVLKIPLGDKFVPVDLQALRRPVMPQLDAQVGLVLGVGAAEQIFRNPLFQHQPVS